MSLQLTHGHRWPMALLNLPSKTAFRHWELKVFNVIVWRGGFYPIYIHIIYLIIFIIIYHKFINIIMKCLPVGRSAPGTCTHLVWTHGWCIGPNLQGTSGGHHLASSKKVGKKHTESIGNNRNMLQKTSENLLWWSLMCIYKSVWMQLVSPTHKRPGKFPSL